MGELNLITSTYYVTKMVLQLATMGIRAVVALNKTLTNKRAYATAMNRGQAFNRGRMPIQPIKKWV